MKKYILLIFCIVILVPVSVKAANPIKEKYEEFIGRLEKIEVYEDIAENSFTIIENQVFTEVFESFGVEPVTFVPALDRKYNRMAVFIVDSEGKVVFKTHQLETNYQIPGEMRQPTKEIAAVSFLDVNGDNNKDIILITRCRKKDEMGTSKKYKVGDVLFQMDGGFYRDYRISEKINRFSMNKSAKSIISFVRDGKSTEFLYTATTTQELLDNEFDIINEQCYPRNFEKLGKLQVIPGTYSMGDYAVFMIYLVNDRGDIVWSFQPMGEYDNLYSLRGITCKDVDGDGMKDIIVLARYSYESPQGELLVESAFSIYYQRTGGFVEDLEFKKQFICTDQHKLDEIVQEIRKFWGWRIENMSDYEEKYK